MPPAVRRIAFFGHDTEDSVVIKRIKAFQSTGADVLGFMFHRERGRTRQPPPFWPNIVLGRTIDRNYLARIPKLCAALWKVLRHRRELRDCDVIYARNIDMMAIAAAGRLLSRSSAPLVYEVLDVQRVFVGTGAVSAVFRWCERRLLAACDMLVVSSPTFMTRYFKPVQGYAGAWYLLENKVSASQVGSFVDDARRPAPGPPWIIGWFGVLRCPKSLDMLSRLAAAHPDTVTVHMRGTTSGEDIPIETLRATAAGRPNFQYHGPYQNPGDLAEIYGQVHFTWAIDYLDAGSNSDWLLPNRLYEGGLFNAVSIAREGTTTGEMVAREGLGVTLPEPVHESLPAWLLEMDAARFEALVASARRAPRTLFVDETDTARLLEAVARHGRERRTVAD